MVKYLLIFIFLSASIIAGTPPVPPPPYGGSDIKDTSITAGKINVGGAASGTVLRSNGPNLAPSWIANDGLLSNAKIYGDLTVYGHNKTINFSRRYDTSNIYCPNGTKLTMGFPDTIKALHPGWDTTDITHPTVIYIPGKYKGFLLWGAFSTNSGTLGEETFIRGSNDGYTWNKITGVPEPVFWHNQFFDGVHMAAKDTSLYSSDPELIVGADGKIYIYTRATWKYFGDSTYDVGHDLWRRFHDTLANGVFVRSYDGSSWSSAKLVIGPYWNALHPGGTSTLMSPAIWVDTASTYRMICVEGTAGWAGDSIPGQPRDSVWNRIQIWGAPKPDSGWAIVDTVAQYGLTGTYTDFPAGSSASTKADDTMGTATYQPWHINVLPNGPDEQIIFLTCVKKNGGGYSEFLAISHDACRTMSYKFTPFLTPTGTATFDKSYCYRAAGWWEDGENNENIKLLYGAYNATTTTWGTGITTIYNAKVDSTQIPLASIPTNRLSGGVSTKIDNITIDSNYASAGKLQVHAGSLTSSHLSSSAAIKRSQLNSTSIDSSWIPKAKIDMSTLDTTAAGLLEIKPLGVQAAQIAATTITGAKVANATLDSTKIINASITLEKVKWDEEYWEATKVWARDTIYGGDSVALSFPRYTGQALTKVRWDFSDSTYDVSTAEKDTITATVTIPYSFVLDSVAYKYVASTSQKIDSIRILNSNPKALSADTSIASDATDRTSTSAARVVTVASKSVGYGGCQFIIEFCITFTANSKGHVRIGDIQFIGHRRQ